MTYPSSLLWESFRNSGFRVGFAVGALCCSHYFAILYIWNAHHRPAEFFVSAILRLCDVMSWTTNYIVCYKADSCRVGIFKLGSRGNTLLNAYDTENSDVHFYNLFLDLFIKLSANISIKKNKNLFWSMRTNWLVPIYNFSRIVW